MPDYISGKTIIITGAGNGFGKLIAIAAGAKGAKLVCADINGDAAKETASVITDVGGHAVGIAVDVTDNAQVVAMARTAVDEFGSIDVLINNAGIMPLALFSDHEMAMPKWEAAIDINLKGALFGIAAVHDQMIAQGSGHVINMSSVFGNHPVYGSAVYGATKAALNYMTESLRVEARGKIKVTTVRPSGVPATGLASTILNPATIVGAAGQNAPDFAEAMQSIVGGTIDPNRLDPENQDFVALSPDPVVDQVIHVIDQPQGVSISEVTVRAAGEYLIL